MDWGFWTHRRKRSRKNPNRKRPRRRDACFRGHHAGKQPAGKSDDQRRPSPPKPKPVVDPPAPSKDVPRPDTPARESTPTGGANQQDEGFEGLPREFIPQAKAARIRPPDGEALQILILEICRRRDWTTPKQLAGWFDMHRRSLSNRHIQPLVKAGLLERKFPDSPNSPKQAYRTRRPAAAEPDAGDGRARGLAVGRPPDHGCSARQDERLRAPAELIIVVYP